MTRFAFTTRENGNAVIRLLPKQLTLVTALLKHERGKLVVRALRLLHAQHVWPYVVEPAKDQRHASENRIDVPGRYQHLV